MSKQQKAKAAQRWKRIIRWLACISGVEQDIRREQYKNDGAALIDASYWFTPEKEYRALYPLLYRMGHRLKDGCSIYGDVWRAELHNILTEQKGNDDNDSI